MEQSIDFRYLYHGTGVYFQSPDLELCHGYRDYGKGFYLSTGIEHAASMARRRSGLTGNVYIYTYQMPQDLIGVNTKIFKAGSVEWLDFIMQNRNYGQTIHPYDIVIGPTADARTIRLIDTYTHGGFGAAASLRAKTKLIEELKPYRFPMQVCICTQTGLEQIRRIDEKRII